MHLVAAGTAVAVPGAAPWALCGVALNHLLITAAGLTPRSNLLGQNMTKLPAAAAARSEIALTIDDGPDPEVTPRVLDLLDVAGARATFFCIANRVRQHAALARDIVGRGHCIQNHTAQHRHHFSLSGPRAFEAEILQAQHIIHDVVGVRPQYFRAPAGLRNPFLAPVLHRLGLTLVTWTRRGFDTRETCPDKVLARLGGRLAAGDILLMHDGNAARAQDGRAVVLHVLPRLLEHAQAQGLTTVMLPVSSAGIRSAAA